MTELVETAQASYQDRKTGLVVFGILQILFGAFCALMVPLMIVGMVMSAKLDPNAPTTNQGSMISGALFYGGLAAWFITMGIGSIRARRWSRALALISSWIWMISGISGLFFVLLLMPDMYGQMGRSGQMPPGVVAVMKTMMIGIMLVFYVLIPGALILFYRSRHVKATCDARDPQTRWTDRCPLPVLALSLLSGVWAVSLSLLGAYHWVLPFFGCIVSGWLGFAVAVVVFLALAYAAWGTYHLRMPAWWCAVGLTIAWALSTAMTFSRVDLVELYEKMDFPAEQMELIKQIGMPQGLAMIAFSVVWFAGFLGYLLFVKRYFTKPAPTP